MQTLVRCYVVVAEQEQIACIKGTSDVYIHQSVDYN
jgi:hypothetical protein